MKLTQVSESLKMIFGKTSASTTLVTLFWVILAFAEENNQYVQLLAILFIGGLSFAFNKSNSEKSTLQTTINQLTASLNQIKTLFTLFQQQTGESPNLEEIFQNVVNLLNKTESPESDEQS